MVFVQIEFSKQSPEVSAVWVVSLVFEVTPLQTFYNWSHKKTVTFPKTKGYRGCRPARLMSVRSCQCLLSFALKNRLIRRFFFSGGSWILWFPPVIQKDWRIFRIVLNHQAGEWSSFGPNSWWTSIKDTLNPFKSTMSKPNKYTSIRFSLPMQNWSSINTSFCCFMVGNSHDDFVKTKALLITQLKYSNSM